MDVRIDPLKLLGFEPGDAHVIRNAGALVTDDVLRSLILSQRLLETRAIAVIAHTDCGLQDFADGNFSHGLELDSGEAPPFAFGSFSDIDEYVREQLDEIASCRWLEHIDDLRGYVFETADGSVREVV